MEPVMYDIGTTHPRGKFCKRMISKNYFISYFSTPFVYEWNGDFYEGNSGDMLIIPPGVPVYHGPKHDAEEGFTNDWIYLQSTELKTLLTRYPLPLCKPFHASRAELLREYIEKIKKEFKEKVPGYEDLAIYMTGNLIIELYRNHIHGDHKKEPADKLEKLRENILHQPEKTWSLAEMAQICGYSVSRFSALYKQRYHVSPKHELLTARIAMAQKMLIYTNATVTEIAYTCGFQSISYFSKQFKKETGISPQEYASKEVCDPKTNKI